MIAITALLPTDSNNEIIFPQGEFYSNEPPLETYLHLEQIILLLKSLEWLWRDREDFFAAGNLTIYYSPNQKKSEDFRGPDFFLVLGTNRNPKRRSWVVWNEDGKYPNLIIEILSDSTAKTDRGEKKGIYQDIFRTPEYFWFEPETLEFQGFILMGGIYQPLEANDRGWLWSGQLGLYLGVLDNKLRYFTPDGKLVLSPEEAAKRAEEAAKEAEDRGKMAAKLEAIPKLLELGLTSEQIAQSLDLDIQTIRNTGLF